MAQKVQNLCIAAATMLPYAVEREAVHLCTHLSFHRAAKPLSRCWLKLPGCGIMACTRKNCQHSTACLTACPSRLPGTQYGTGVMAGEDSGRRASLRQDLMPMQMRSYQGADVAHTHLL